MTFIDTTNQEQCRLSPESDTKVPNQQLTLNDLLLQVNCGERGRSGLVECCFTSTETVGLLGTGAQDGHRRSRRDQEEGGGAGPSS